MSNYHEQLADLRTEEDIRNEEAEFKEALADLVRAIKAMPPYKPQYAIREKPVEGAIKGRGYERRCLHCHAAFLPLVPQKTGKVGVWTEAGWFCSEQCFAEGWEE